MWTEIQTSAHQARHMNTQSAEQSNDATKTKVKQQDDSESGEVGKDVIESEAAEKAYDSDETIPYAIFTSGRDVGNGDEDDNDEEDEEPRSANRRGRPKRRLSIDDFGEAHTRLKLRNSRRLDEDHGSAGHYLGHCSPIDAMLLQRFQAPTPDFTCETTIVNNSVTAVLDFSGASPARGIVVCNPATTEIAVRSTDVNAQLTLDKEEVEAKIHWMRIAFWQGKLEESKASSGQAALAIAKTDSSLYDVEKRKSALADIEHRLIKKRAVDVDTKRKADERIEEYERRLNELGGECLNLLGNGPAADCSWMTSKNEAGRSVRICFVDSLFLSVKMEVPLWITVGDVPLLSGVFS
ncbi:MAG: hypothetical protein M1827_002225 [Pycnora praestabilis]|nr:MAG: hypothetical protein M1827_002225 [Pycnora praestabilis]